MAKTLKDEIAMVALNGLLSLGERGTDETEAELEAGAMINGVEGRLWAAFKGCDGMIEIEEDEPEIEDE